MTTLPYSTTLCIGLNVQNFNCRLYCSFMSSYAIQIYRATYFCIRYVLHLVLYKSGLVCTMLTKMLILKLSYNM